MMLGALRSRRGRLWICFACLLVVVGLVASSSIEFGHPSSVASHPGILSLEIPVDEESRVFATTSNVIDATRTFARRLITTRDPDPLRRVAQAFDPATGQTQA